MKIRIALLSSGSDYHRRLSAVLQARYSQEIEIYMFSEFEPALPVIQESRVEILLADEDCPVDAERLPRRCTLIYLSDIQGIASVQGHPAIFRYQNVEQIYKQMLGIYAENAGALPGSRIGSEDGARLIVFSSPAGGVGTTTLAAACAQYFANHGSRTLYVNLETYGSADLFFSGTGQFDLSDVIYTIKSKKGNLPLKLESCVKMDPNGVNYFSPPKIALDLTELKPEEYVELLKVLESMGKFDYVILDADFSIREDRLSLYRQAHCWVMVTDGTPSANQKTSRAYKSLTIREQNTDVPLMNRIFLAYNRFTSRSSAYLTEVKLEELGTAPGVANAGQKQVIETLAGLSWFERLR